MYDVHRTRVATRHSHLAPGCSAGLLTTSLVPSSRFLQWTIVTKSRACRGPILLVADQETFVSGESHSRSRNSTQFSLYSCPQGRCRMWGLCMGLWAAISIPRGSSLLVMRAFFCSRFYTQRNNAYLRGEGWEWVSHGTQTPDPKHRGIELKTSVETRTIRDPSTHMHPLVVMEKLEHVVRVGINGPHDLHACKLGFAIYNLLGPVGAAAAATVTIRAWTNQKRCYGWRAGEH